MKISNASKKVLASALSAAMVVAFAPTVAFGAADSATADGTKTVAVTFNANGGTVTAGCAGFTTELLKDADGKYFVKVSGTNTATDASYGASTGWFVDADGDGLYNSRTEKKVAIVGSDNYVEVAADTTAVELKAIYTMPTVGFENSAFTGAATYTNGSISDNKAASFTVKTSTKGKAGHTYVLTVKNPNGDTVGTKTFGANTAAGEAAVSELANDQTVFFTANPVTGDTMATWMDKLVSGEYTASLTDNGKEISTAKVSLAKVTAKVGDNSASQFVQLVDGKKTVKLAKLETPYVAYLDADGYNAGTLVNAGQPEEGTEVEVTGDATFTATKVAQAVSAVEYTATAGDHGTIGFTLAAGATKYAVSISDKDGVIYTGTYKTSNAKTVFFDGTIGEAHTNAVEKAGSYVVTVVATDSDDNETTSKAKMDLTEVKYAVGEGVKFNDNSDAASGDKTNWTKAAFQTAYTSDAAPAPTAIDTVAAAKDGYTLAAAWQLNGKAYDAKENKLKVGESNTLTAVATAKTLAAAPGYTVEKSTAGTTTQYVLTVTPAANTSVAVSDGTDLGTITTAKAFIIDGTKDITLTASSTVPGVGNKVITLKTANGLVKAWNTATASGSSKLELLEGNTGAKWSAAAGVKAAIESGKAAYEALAAKYYVSSEEITAVDLAAKKALYEAILAEANAQIASYKDGANVVAGTKVWNMTAANYKDAIEKLAGEEKKLAKELKDATEAAQATAYKKYALGTASLITTANTLLVKATENKAVKAADVKAATEATAALKAAKTADEAKAALEAYSKLSDDAKKLVATADVAAAQKIVSDAEMAQKLKDSQDLAAARDLNGKKVTAKAKVGKKATGKSFTYKLAASESGATATYKKVSGSKYIKVSKSGKVSFKAVKVQKKAKTYSAKVSVTYGTQTVTKTVKLVVKKK